MKIRLALFSVLALLLAGAPTVASGAAIWRVDADHTRVGFSVTHLGINTVHGVFKKFTAEVVADDAGKLSSVTAEVFVRSVDTGNEKRDTHLRAEDVFDATAYPAMKLATKKIVWKGKRFSGTASLTIKNVTRAVPFTGSLTGVKTVEMGGKREVRAGYTVEATIDRTAFGIAFGGFSEGLGMVGESVKVSLDVELVKSE